MTMVGCRAIHRISDNAYNRMITRQGPTNAELKRTRTTCLNCGVEVQNGSLKKHMLSKRCLNHNTGFNQQDMVCIPINETTTDTFVISMDGDNNTQCPHQDCPYTTTKRERMRKHFRSNSTRRYSSAVHKLWHFSKKCTNRKAYIILGMSTTF
jgi:hypothetical protein